MTFLVTPVMTPWCFFHSSTIHCPIVHKIDKLMTSVVKNLKSFILVFSLLSLLILLFLIYFHTFFFLRHDVEEKRLCMYVSIYIPMIVCTYLCISKNLFILEKKFLISGQIFETKWLVNSDYIVNGLCNKLIIFCEKYFQLWLEPEKNRILKEISCLTKIF